MKMLQWMAFIELVATIKNREGTRTIIVKLANAWQNGVLLLSTYKLKQYPKKNFISEELSESGRKLEGNCLITRSILIKSGTQRSEL